MNFFEISCEMFFFFVHIPNSISVSFINIIWRESVAQVKLNDYSSQSCLGLSWQQGHSICPSYSHREPQRVQTPACQGWPILCHSSWRHCPPASDPNIFLHLGRRNGSTSGNGFLQTPASELWMMERMQRRGRSRRRGREREVIKIKRGRDKGETDIKHTYCTVHAHREERDGDITWGAKPELILLSLHIVHYFFVWWVRSSSIDFYDNTKPPMMFTKRVSCQEYILISGRTGWERRQKKEERALLGVSRQVSLVGLVLRGLRRLRTRLFVCPRASTVFCAVVTGNAVCRSATGETCNLYVFHS